VKDCGHDEANFLYLGFAIMALIIDPNNESQNGDNLNVHQPIRPPLIANYFLPKLQK